MGYIGTCRGIGYGFRGSRSLNRVSFFYPFDTVFLVWSVDRVANLYYLIMESENARLNECFLKKTCRICSSINKIICNRGLIALDRMSFFGFGS